jgi:hypothetical protein
VIEILARYPVARSQQLVLLKLARRIVLLHQSGAAMRTLCELSDADEVAGVLARLEAGSNQRGAERFRATLNEFMTEHDAKSPARWKGRTVLPPGEAEIIDLTRRRSPWLSAILGGRASR